MLTKPHILADAKTIKKRLIDLGITQTEIAKDLSVTKSAVSRVISGKLRSEKIFGYIVTKLGIEVPNGNFDQKHSECPKLKNEYRTK